MNNKLTFEEIEEMSPVIVDQGVQELKNVSKIFIDAAGVITALSKTRKNPQTAKVWSWEELREKHPYIDESFLEIENSSPP